MYLGQKDIKSLAAEMEFAEMLIPSVTMINPMAPNADAARPPCDPDELQSSMMTIGFQTISLYTFSDAAAVKMPSSPTTVKMKGIAMAWILVLLGFLAYLAKSEMFKPSVA